MESGQSATAVIAELTALYKILDINFCCGTKSFFHFLIFLCSAFVCVIKRVTKSSGPIFVFKIYSNDDEIFSGTYCIRNNIWQWQTIIPGVNCHGN
jgi:hypothetical protein